MNNNQHTSFNSKTFMNHVKKLSELSGAGFSKDDVEKSFRVIEDRLFPESAPMGWKVTPGSIPRAYFNILNHKSLDFLRILKEEGLIPKMYLEDPKYQAAYKLLDGHLVDGADFNTNAGLCKVWAYTNMASLDSLLRNPYLPESVRKYETTLRSFGLDKYFFLASDFEKNSMNVYFPWNEKQRNSEWVAGFSKSFGEGISDVALKGILETCDDTIGIGITFDWDSDEALRACFYNTSPSESAPALDNETRKIREKIRNEMPVLIDNPSFFYNWSIGRGGEYIKIEKDYSGDFWNHVETAYNLNRDDVNVLK